jgi:hypothetical protein
MGSSRRVDLQAVWRVQSRKILSQLEFWLVLIGYDRQTHSFSSWIYLVYVFIFFSVWVFAVLGLLAGIAGQVLTALPFANPLRAAVALGAAAFVAVLLLELYFAARKSPFVFSEADAHLLCLTPVDRRVVSLVWFLAAWLGRSLLVWPGSIVLGYALLEAQTAGELDFSDLPLYLLAGLRMLVVAIPLHLSAQSLAWSAGAWRLQGKRDLPALRWAAPALTVLLAAGWILSGQGGGEGVPAWLWPAAFPVQAGLGAASLPAGLGLALAGAMLGLYFLWAASGELSLARASQETRGQEALQAAVWTGAADLAREIRQRERLGAGRRPSRLPARPGLAALVWRDAIHWRRSLTLGELVPWLGIFGLTLGLFLVPDWGARAWITVFWLVAVGGTAMRNLRRDLGRWMLARQLPFPSENIVLAGAVLPLAGIALSASAALALAALMGSPLLPVAGWLLLPGIVGIALAAAVDILQQCRTDRLLAGSVPGLTFLTVLLGGLALAIPGSMAWMAIARWTFQPWTAIGLMLVVSIGLDYALYRLAGRILRNLR